VAVVPTERMRRKPNTVSHSNVRAAGGQPLKLSSDGEERVLLSCAY
jgi:hypothetical protein